MRGTFVAVACLAVTGNIRHYPCAIEMLYNSRQQVQVTVKIVGLPSPDITALPGSIPRSKHIGYVPITTAHAPLEGFERAFPSFRVIVKNPEIRLFGAYESQLF